MRTSASFCREQEASQAAKATNEPLEQRRKVALAASKAWGREAIFAERREQKQNLLDKLDAEIALEFANEEATDEAD